MFTRKVNSTLLTENVACELVVFVDIKFTIPEELFELALSFK